MEYKKEYTKKVDRINRIPPNEYMLLTEEEEANRQENIKKYIEFHRKLHMMDRENERN